MWRILATDEKGVNRNERKPPLSAWSDRRFCILSQPNELEIRHETIFNVGITDPLFCVFDGGFCP